MSANGQPAGIGARALRALPAFLLVALLAALPLFHPGANRVKLLFLTFSLIAASVGWNVLGGFAGQVSFGFAVFYGIGAYATAVGINEGMNPYLTFVLAAVLAAIASWLIGVPTFRLRGPYFAIATIGVSEAVRVVMSNLEFTGGASGYRITEHVPFRQDEHYYTALALAVLAVAVSIAVQRSRFGLGLRAIRDDEDAAADSGVNPFASKLGAHAIAAALTAAAGGVFARYAAFIDPEGVFGFHQGIVILLMPVIGGVNTVWGPVIGGGVYGVIEEELSARFPQLHLLLYGLLVILIVLFEPGGVMGLLRRLRRLMPRKKEASWQPS